MAPSVTALGRLGIGATSTVDSALDYIDFNPGVRRELRDMNGTRGKFSKDGNRVRVNRNTVTPRLRAEPTISEWTKYLPWITGGTPSGTPAVAYPLGNATVEKFVHWKPVAGEAFLLTGVAVDVATLRAASGEPLALELDLVGRLYDAAPAAFPAISPDVVTQPFILSDLVLTVEGVERQCRDLFLSVRNNIDRNRHLNSLNLTTTQKLSRQVVFNVSVPSGDNVGLWDAGADGATLSAVFTNPTNSAVLSVTGVDWRFVPASPEHPFNGEGYLALEGELYMAAGGTEALVITLNPGS